MHDRRDKAWNHSRITCYLRLVIYSLCYTRFLWCAIHTYYMHTYMFVVVNFDALTQASDIQIERRQVVFLCWMQDLNRGPRYQIASRLNARWQTDWAIEDQAENLNSTALPYDQRTLSPRLLLLISMLWYRQAIFKSKGDKLCSSAECRIWTRGPRHHIASTLNARWQTDWAIEDQAKNLNIRTYIHTCLLLLISMLWHKQAIFESKGDKLSSSAEGRIRTHQGLRHQIASRLNARWQTDWAIKDQAENLNSTARSYDQRAFSPLDLTAVWHSHLALAIYMFVVTNFDALAQASDIRIERRQVVFLCWRQDSNPSGLRHQIASRLNARWQTDWAIEDQAKNWNIRTYIHTCLLLLISMLWHRQAIFESKVDKLSSSAEGRIRTH